MPTSLGRSSLEIRSMVFSWGSGLAAKPSITLRAGLAVPGRMAAYEFLASYRRESGLAISGHLVRLPRAIELSLMAMLSGGCKLAWSETQHLTASVLPNGRLPGSSLILRSVAMYEPRQGRSGRPEVPGPFFKSDAIALHERAGRSLLAGRHFALTASLHSRAEGTLAINVSADGQVSFGTLLMGLNRPGIHLELDPRVETNARSTGPALVAFGRAVLTGFSQN